MAGFALMMLLDAALGWAPNRTRTEIDMIKDDLLAECIAIGIQGEMIRYIGDNGVTTRRMLEERRKG